MPAWPDTGRADRIRPADSSRHGDALGAASHLYDAYADRLHDYAVSLLDDRDATAAVVHDAMRPSKMTGWRIRRFIALKSGLRNGAHSVTSTSASTSRQASYW